jgi:hypothetical protein
MAARKKARKGAKKAGKKAPRKSASKKKRKSKRKKKVGPPKDFIVKLMSNNQGANTAPRTSRKRRDLVKWVNESTVERRLTFKDGVWPFEGAPSDILVPLNGESGWYRVTKHPGEAGVISYGYTSTPVFGQSGGPGDPVVDSGD